ALLERERSRSGDARERGASGVLVASDAGLLPLLQPSPPGVGSARRGLRALRPARKGRVQPGGYVAAIPDGLLRLVPDERAGVDLSRPGDDGADAGSAVVGVLPAAGLAHPQHRPRARPGLARAPHRLADHRWRARSVPDA